MLSLGDEDSVGTPPAEVALSLAVGSTVDGSAAEEEFEESTGTRVLAEGHRVL